VSGRPERQGPRGQAVKPSWSLAVVALMTVIMLLFVVEMGRMVLVYTTVANAARAGVRYAIVHGSSRAVGPRSTAPAGRPVTPPRF
jgi:hypothetical protein